MPSDPLGALSVERREDRAPLTKRQGSPEQPCQIHTLQMLSWLDPHSTAAPCPLHRMPFRQEPFPSEGTSSVPSEGRAGPPSPGPCQSPPSAGARTSADAGRCRGKASEAVRRCLGVETTQGLGDQALGKPSEVENTGLPQRDTGGTLGVSWGWEEWAASELNAQHLVSLGEQSTARGPGTGKAKACSLHLKSQGQAGGQDVPPGKQGGSKGQGTAAGDREAGSGPGEGRATEGQWEEHSPGTRKGDERMEGGAPVG